MNCYSVILIVRKVKILNNLFNRIINSSLKDEIARVLGTSAAASLFTYLEEPEHDSSKKILDRTYSNNKEASR